MTDQNRHQQQVDTGMSKITVASESPAVNGVYVVSGAPQAEDNRTYDVRATRSGDFARLNGLLKRYYVTFNGSHVRNVGELQVADPA